MSENIFDIAQICLYGHVVNEYYSSYPQYNQKFCVKCGAPTITNCTSCDKPIKGGHRKNFGGYIPPSFCHECGKPYPWTEAKLKAARELADEFENLSPEEREILKKSYDDIIKDTPQTAVAATRFKKLVLKIGKPAAGALRDILVDIASEAAKKVIWPS